MMAFIVLMGKFKNKFAYLFQRVKSVDQLTF